MLGWKKKTHRGKPGDFSKSGWASGPNSFQSQGSSVGYTLKWRYCYRRGTRGARPEPLRLTEVTSAPQPAAGPLFLQKTLLVSAGRPCSVPMGTPVSRDRARHPDAAPVCARVCAARVCTRVHVCACVCAFPHPEQFSNPVWVSHAPAQFRHYAPGDNVRPPGRGLGPTPDPGRKGRGRQGSDRRGRAAAPAAPSWHSVNLSEDSEPRDRFPTGPPCITRR